MANISYANWAPSQINNEMNHVASIECEVGDQTYYDIVNFVVKPASSFPDGGTAVLTQQAFAAYFAGLALSRQLATDSTARRAKLLIDTIVEFPCASTTFEIGDYVAPTWTTGVLSDQEVTKVTDPSRAIGRVVKRYAAATTTVKVRMTSPVFADLSLSGGAGANSALAIYAAAGSATGAAGSTLALRAGAGFQGTSGTAGAGGAYSAQGGAGGVATSGTGGAGGAYTGGGAAGGTATTGTGGAGGASTLSSGAGAAATGAAGIGGAGGTWTANAGVGGAASDTVSGNAGAGGAWAGAAGAGGAATGTTTAAGGVGGAWTGGGGAGGTAAGTSAAGAGGAVTLSSGVGGAKTGTGAAAGGAGGAVGITAGTGGATANSSTSAGGAGGTITLTGGTGGAASAGTGNGGAGGGINLTPGAGGSSAGGTAGVRGVVTATGLRVVAGSTAVAITSATTLTLADSGGVFTVAQSSAYAITLPSPTSGPGTRFLFQLVSPGANNVTLTVSGSAATFEGTIQNDVTSTLPATGGTFTFASGVSALGDWIEVISTSTSKYFARTSASANGGITIA